MNIAMPPVQAVQAENQFAKNIALRMISVEIGRLETNAEQVLGAVKERVAEYRDLEQYAGRIDAAKADRAFLRKEKEKIKEFRKDAEARWNAPLAVFKETIKEIGRVYDEAIESIDGLAKYAEAREKEVKRQEIQAYFNGKNFELLPLEKLFDARWLNKTYKMADIRAEIDGKIAGVYESLKTLEQVPEHSSAAKALYLETLDMGAALRRVETLKENALKLAREQADREERELRERIGQNLAEQKEERKAQADSARAERTKSLADQALDLPSAVPAPDPAKPQMYTVTLRFTGPRDRLYALKAWMSANGIAYEKI